MPVLRRYPVRRSRLTERPRSDMSGGRCKQVFLVGLLFQKFREVARDPGHPEKRDRAVFAGFGDQGGGIEIRPGIAGGQHEGRVTISRQDVAHHERAGTVIALDEQLGFAQHADVDAGSAPPRRFFPVQSVPLHDVAYAATLLFVKPLFRRRKMPRGPFSLAAAPEDDGVHLKEELEIPHRKQIEASPDQAVHEFVAGHHVRDEGVLDRIAAGFECLIDFREMSLQIPKRGFDRRQI